MFSDSGYSIDFLLSMFFLLIIIMFSVFFLLRLTSYFVIHAYCVLLLWVGGMDVYNVGSPLFVCACFMGRRVCVLHAE